MTKKLTLEFCKREAEKRGYEIREEIYIDAQEKMEFFHFECGTSSFKSWGNFSSGHGCKKCASRKYGDTLLIIFGTKPSMTSNINNTKTASNANMPNNMAYT
jgi:hypothetical protein